MSKWRSSIRNTETYWLQNFIGTKGIFRKLALDKTLESNEGYIGVSTAERVLVGKHGVASTVLRPSGKVKVDDVVYDAVSSDGTFIEKGTDVKVPLYYYIIY